MTAKERLAMIVAGIRGRKLRDKEVIQYKVNIHAKLEDTVTGEIKLDEWIAHNLIVTAGKDLLLSVASSKYVKDFNRMAIGSVNTSPSASDTALGAELARTTALTPTNPTSSTLQFQNTYAAGTGTGTVREVGMFDANSSGNMLNRSVFGDIVKGATDALTMTVQFT